jgi:predicted dehydrogenase
VQAEQAGAGLFMDIASHTLDVLDFLFGALQDVAGEAKNALAPGDVEDQVSLRFTTQAGAAGVGYWNFSSPTHEDIIEIVGAAGRLRLSTFGDTPLLLETASGSEQFSLINPRHIQAPLIQTIVDTLLGRGTCPSSGVSAARTSRVMDRALAGYYGSRDDGFWKHPERWPGRRARV